MTGVQTCALPISFIDTKFDKEDLKRRQNSDPTVAVIAAALKHYEEEKEAAAITATVGSLFWRRFKSSLSNLVSIKVVS